MGDAGVCLYSHQHHKCHFGMIQFCNLRFFQVIYFENRLESNYHINLTNKTFVIF